jgi:hypothetical protein
VDKKAAIRQDWAEHIIMPLMWEGPALLFGDVASNVNCGA